MKITFEGTFTEVRAEAADFFFATCPPDGLGVVSRDAAADNLSEAAPKFEIADPDEVVISSADPDAGLDHLEGETVTIIEGNGRERGKPSPGKKRRTKVEIAKDKADEAAEQTEAQDAAETATTEDPPAPSRRRGVAQPEAPTDKPASRRRGVAIEDMAVTKVTPPEDAEGNISDADVTKAASHAAQKITPRVVKEILAEFGTANTADLDQEQRQEFVERLNAEMADE